MTSDAHGKVTSLSEISRLVKAIIEQFYYLRIQNLHNFMLMCNHDLTRVTEKLMTFTNRLYNACDASIVVNKVFTCIKIV